MANLNVVEVDEAQVEIVQKKSLTILEEAKGFEITDSEDLQAAASLMKNIKGLIKEMESTFNGPIKDADNLHSLLISKRNVHLVPAQNAYKMMGDKCTSYQLEQDRIQREQEKKEREEAERKRKEELAKIEEQKKKDLKAAHTKKQQAIIKEEAEAEKEEIEEAPLIIQAPARVKVQGLSIRENWKYRVLNEKLVPKEHWMLDDKSISGVVKAMKGKTNIPGIEAYNAGSASVR